MADTGAAAALVEFAVNHKVLTICAVLAVGAAVGRIRVGPLKFGAAGALFVGLLAGAADPRLGEGLDLVKTFGVVLFCYAVGLTAGATFISDLKRQWALMLSGVVGLGVMAAVASAAGKLVGLSPAHISGLYAGTLTSPAIDAAEKATDFSPDTLVGYAVSYPVGVLVALLMTAVITTRTWPAHGDVPSQAESGITAQSTYVDTAVTVADVPGFADGKVRMSYLLRESDLGIAHPRLELQPGDEVLLVGSPDDVAQAVQAIGRPADEKDELTANRQTIDFRRFVISNNRLAGRKLGKIREDFRTITGGVITRVRRGDLDMLGTDDVVLQPGDRVLAVVPNDYLRIATDFFGDSEQGSSNLNALTLGLGATLGLVAGAFTLNLPGGLTFSLGAAAGPLVVGMVLGAVHKTGPLRWDMSHAEGTILKQIGLMVFLACVGLASGPSFAEQALTSTGAKLAAVAAVSLLVGGVISITGAFISQLSAQRAAGAFAGFVGQPAILQYALSLRNDERIESAYGALFALGTIVKILLVQVIVLV
ncbi:aspartate:alanine exchanger family transporter [Corynebacterium mendelii]|uniref:Transporter n=1 Tax=Corynebacterium mendelii TaxID=2765362 RepID=A0A939E2Q0_9CORY|nr:TrkA C-terminal domain-containing protein [Corynebacterium mendelii]MBN9644412.1 transporter [Corynebacterium mendelii]